MKFEVLIIIVAILCTTKCTSYARKVSGVPLLKVEYGGSGNDYYIDTLTSSVKKLGAGTKKHDVVDIDSESSGEGEVRVVVNDNVNSSGEGSTSDDEDNEGSATGGSGHRPEPPVTIAPPTFKISTVQSNLTSPATVILINIGSSSEKSGNIDETTTTTKPPDDDIDNTVEDDKRGLPHTTDNTIIDNNNNEVVIGRNTGQSNSENSTIAIIVCAVVGAILSIWIIVFLVYRLRKKDEGSYSLDETTNMFQTDTDSQTAKGKDGEYIA